MTSPLHGVRVVEVASHVFVPMSGSILGEWGAEVIKIEHPETGDPYRGLVTGGMGRTAGGVDPRFHSANRGKRSVGLDVKHPEGRQLLSRLLATCDVFVTNLRAETIDRLRLDVDRVRADNPSIIYVRGTAFGPEGPDAGRGGYDAGAYWARSGMQHIFTRPGDEWPAGPRPAFGDVVGGMTIAGAISTALYRRAVHGEPSVIDVALLATGMWQIQSDLVNSLLLPPELRQRRSGAGMDRSQMFNPLMLAYRTRDGRFVSLQMLSPERYWPALCKAIGQPEMATDARFVDMEARRQNSADCIAWLDEVFAARDYDEWCRVLADFEGEWVPVQAPYELVDDPQVVANGYLGRVELGNGETAPMVPSPVQFDGRRNEPRRGPEHGEHTEEVLLDLDLSWDEISALKERKVIL
ncbi:MAG TPA: CoA transferase [Acidimicrobiia bacterium]|nr:CoA transferase [Acidimicrobiia bacterium]